MSGKHYREVDIARGFGIILVVFGHALKQTGVDARWIRVLDCLIYSFHMPLFFVLSGFVAVKILRMKQFRERLFYLRGRAMRLLIPYFVIGLIYVPVKLKLSRYAVKPFKLSDTLKLLIGQNPDTSLWFLYVLFLVTAIAALFVNEINFRSVWYGSAALCAASWWVNIPFRTPKYLFFFLAGFWLRLKVEDLEKENREGAYLMDGQFISSFLALIIFIVLNRFYYKTGVSVLRFFTSLCGIYITMYISSFLAYEVPDSRFSKILERFGSFSMDIYILHEPVMTAAKILFWGKLGLGYVQCTLLIFIAAILVPVPVSKGIIRRIPLLRFLFFGERMRKAAGKDVKKA